MSDTDARPGRAAAETALAELDAFRHRLRLLIGRHDRDDPIRPVLIAELFAYDDMVERVRPALEVPADGPPPREVGLATREWKSSVLGSLRRNQRPR